MFIWHYCKGFCLFLLNVVSENTFTLELQYQISCIWTLFSLTRVNSTSCEMISERPNEDYSLDKDIDFTFSILEVKLETTLMSPD